MLIDIAIHPKTRPPRDVAFVLGLGCVALALLLLATLL